MVRQSGGRYLLPIDWMTGLFFSVGIVEWGKSLVINRNRDIAYGSIIDEETGITTRGKRSNYKPILLSVVILMIGISIPAVEYIVPNSYPEDIGEQKIDYLLSDQNSQLSSADKKRISSVLDDGNGSAIYGRALYPRYYEPGQQAEGIYYKYFDHSITFYVVGEDFVYAVIPVDNIPDYLPHAADVIVVGCEGELFSQVDTHITAGHICENCKSGGFDTLAAFIYFDEADQWYVIWRNEGMGTNLSCPLDWPE